MIINILLCISTIAVLIFIVHDVWEMIKWLNNKDNDDDEYKEDDDYVYFNKKKD